MNASHSHPSVPAAEALFDRRMARVMEAVGLHHTYLVSYLSRMTNRKQDAEDICQDLWRYVVVHFKYEQIGCLGLLRRKAYQLFIDHYRSAKRRNETLVGESFENEMAAPRESHFSDAGEAELKEKFWSEFPDIDLTDAQREVLWLYARYGMTYKEIEARLGIASSTIGDWISLGRERLSAYLELND